MKFLVLLVVIGMFCAAFQHVLIDAKLRQFSPAISIFASQVVLISLFAILLIMSWKTIPKDAWPSHWSTWALLFGRGAIIAVGLLCVMTAYNRGLPVIVITMIYTLIPIAASIMKGLYDGTWPTWRQWAGALLAMIAVWLVTSGPKTLPSTE